MPCLSRYVNLKTPLAGRWTKVKCRRLYSTVRALWGWNQSKHNCLWEERKTLVQKIRSIFQPIRFKIKTTTWSPAFSRASGSLRVATLSSHWPLLTFLAVWLAFMISLVLAPNKKTLQLCYWNMGQVEGKKVALNHMIPNLVVPFDYIDLSSICCLTWPLVDTSPSIRFVLCAVLWNWRRRHTLIHEGSSISKSMFYVLFYHSEVALNLLLYLCPVT